MVIKHFAWFVLMQRNDFYKNISLQFILSTEYLTLGEKTSAQSPISKHYVRDLYSALFIEKLLILENLFWKS